MRIFQVLEVGSNSLVSGSQTWLRNLHEPLIEMGHDVVLFRAEDGRRAMASGDHHLRARFSEHLLQTYRDAQAVRPFDLLFAYLMDGMVEPSTIDELRRSGVPTCNFSCNNVHQFGLVDEISPHFDFSLHSERDVADKFRAVGARPVWFQMAANPEYYAPRDLARTLDASFVGMNYASRADYIFHLLENGVDVHAFGPGWRATRSPIVSWLARQRKILGAALAHTPESRARWSARLARADATELLRGRYGDALHPPVTDERMIELYSVAKVTLGFLEVFVDHDPSGPRSQHLHLREFEAPMAGAVYCTNYSDELAEHYEPDREVVTFRDRYELVDKVKYYLSHPEQAEAVRRAGRERALRDHTWQRRFTDLFRQLGLPPQSMAA